MPLLACEPITTVEEVLDASCACDLNEGEHGDLIADYIDDASDVLYVLSGGRVHGRCTRTVWPFRDVNTCGPRSLLSGWPNDSQSWVSWDGVDSIPLRGPNTSIVEVTIDGDVIDPADYGLLNGNKLFRRTSYWPDVNDVTKADTEDGTFTITYRFGDPYTMSQKRAGNEIICSMVKNDKQQLSRLRGIVSANVQGVSVTLDDDEAQSMGLPEVARFIEIYGNSGRQRVGVWAPETDHGWHLVSVSGGNQS